jgi:hypothetical protein
MTDLHTQRRAARLAEHEPDHEAFAMPKAEQVETCAHERREERIANQQLCDKCASEDDIAIIKCPEGIRPSSVRVFEPWENSYDRLGEWGRVGYIK